MVAIVTPSVVLIGRGIRIVAARQAICWRKHYADHLENVAPSGRKMVRMSHFWELAVRWLWHRVNDDCYGTVMCNPSVVFQANEVVRCGEP
jgi:hypothetical protein